MYFCRKLFEMTKLYLVRHGETQGNIEHILQGQMQGELTENGIKQAEALRDKFAEVYFDAFISSDLKRASETCRIIAEPHDLPVVTTPVLRERDWGELTGKAVTNPFAAEWPETVETEAQIMERARKFLTSVKEQYPGKVILAVGHGIMNRAIQAVVYGRDMQDVARMNNGDIRILELK